MKYLAVGALALTICCGTVAQAGNLHAPIIDKDIIVEDAKAGSSSSAVMQVALFSLMMFAAALAN